MTSIEGVEIVIGGVRFAGFDSGASFTYGTVDEDGEFEPRAYKPGVYEATCTIELDRRGVDRLLDALCPRPRGASDVTLAKRVRYGGRKGRSAWRRLRAKGFVGIVTLDGHTFPLSTELLDAFRRSVTDSAVERSLRALRDVIDLTVGPDEVGVLVDELGEIIAIPVRLEPAS